MKSCLICLHGNEDKAETCPMCGEASWCTDGAERPEYFDLEPLPAPPSNMGELVVIDPEPLEMPERMSAEVLAEELELAVVSTEEAPKKRGPGRPKKDAS